MVHPNQGQPQGDSDRAFEPAGNRPAQNARQATPGSILSQTKLPSQAATDFLGLGEQVAPAAQMTPGGLLWQAAQGAGEPQEQQQEQEPEAAEAFEEPATDRRGPRDDQALDEGSEDDDGSAESEGVHRSWVDDSPATRSRSMLPKVALALGLGMAAMTGLLVMQNQGGEEPGLPAPLSPDMNATPGYEARLLEGAPPEGAGASVSEVSEVEEVEAEPVAALDEPSEFDPDAPPWGIEAQRARTELALEKPLASEVKAVEEPAQSAPLVAAEHGSAGDADPEPAVEGLAEHTAREGAPPSSITSSPAPRRAALHPVWEEIGETPPPGALSAFASASPPASADSGAMAQEPEARTWVVVGDDAGASSLEEHPYWDAPGDERVGSIAAPPAADGAALEAEPLPSEPAATVADAEPIPTAPEPALEASPQPPSAGGEVGFFGPVLPAGSAPVVENAPEDGEVTSNVRVRRLDPSQVVEPDQRGPRMANASELKGVWLQEAVPPMWTIQEAQKVLTPQVGQVRVILEGNEIFQGRLYAMGEGRVWINNERFGQMGLEGGKVAKIVRIDVDDDSPVPGEAGSQDLGGLESVRVKTPGGVLFGKVIARDEVRTTIVTEDGTRVTLASDQVEFLSEAPSVALKRAGQPKAQEKATAEEPAPDEPAAEGQSDDEGQSDAPAGEPEAESPSEPRDAPVQGEPVPVKPVKRP